MVIPSKPRDDDPPLPHEQRIRSVFPGTGGDDGFSPRPQQVQALSHIIQAIEGGSTDIFLQMPTGGGKSVIGHALSKLVSASCLHRRQGRSGRPVFPQPTRGSSYRRCRSYACRLKSTVPGGSTAEVAEALARERAVQYDRMDTTRSSGSRRPFCLDKHLPDVRVSTGWRSWVPCSFSRVPAGSATRYVRITVRGGPASLPHRRSMGRLSEHCALGPLLGPTHVSVLP